MISDRKIDTCDSRELVREIGLRNKIFTVPADVANSNDERFEKRQK